jgi:hypothetical protein
VISSSFSLLETHQEQMQMYWKGRLKAYCIVPKRAKEKKEVEDDYGYRRSEFRRSRVTLKYVEQHNCSCLSSPSSE